MIKPLSILLLASIALTMEAQRVSPSFKVSEYGIVEPVSTVTNNVWLAKAKHNKKPEIEKKVKAHGPKNKSKHFVHLNLVRLEIDSPKLLQSLREDVEYIEPDSLVSINATPTDPMWAQQWDMVNISMPAAWDRTIGNQDIVVAVFDTGIDFTHLDLQSNLYTDANGFHGWQSIGGMMAHGGLDDHGHGTHVAGTIGASANNGIGIAGMNWRVQLMAMKFLDKGGSGWTSDCIALLDKAVELKANGVNIRIGNNSWGSGGIEKALQDAYQMAEDAGILSICASGNSKQDIDISPIEPAGIPNRGIVSVNASDQVNNLATFSNYGFISTDVAAPGVSTLSTVPTNTSFYISSAAGYKTASGTSMATPHVSGLAALALSLNPNLTIYELKDLILNSQSTDEMAGMGLLSSTGAKINAQKTFANPLLYNPKTNSQPVITDIKAYDVSAGKPATVSFSASDPDGDVMRFLTVDKWNKAMALTNFVSFPTENKFLDVTYPFFIGASDKNGGSASSNTFITAYRDLATLQLQDYKIGISATNVPGTKSINARVWLITNSQPAKEVYFKPYMTGNGDNAWVFDWIPIGSGYNFTYNFMINTNGSYEIKAYTSNYQLYPHAESERIIIRMGTDATNTSAFPIINAKFESLSGVSPFALKFAITNLSNTGTNNLFYVQGSVGNCRNCNYTSSTGSFFNGTLTFEEIGVKDVQVLVRDNETMNWDIMEYQISVLAPSNSVPIPPPVMNAPSGLTVTRSGASMVLNWNDNSAGEDRYEVEMTQKKTGPFPPFRTVATLPPNSIGYPQSGGIKNWNYQFRVRCASGTNESGYSNVASIRFK